MIDFLLPLLPIFGYFLLVILICGWYPTSYKQEFPWYAVLLIAAAFWGAYTVLASEFLSLLGFLTRIGISAGWTLFLFVIVVYGWRTGKTYRGWLRLWKSDQSLEKWEWIPVVLLAIILLALCVIAYWVVPNNTDSLLYHMSRVAHWIQNGSLAHYPVAYEHQLWNPIWAEVAIIQFYALAADEHGGRAPHPPSARRQGTPPRRRYLEYTPADALAQGRRT